mgnify:CR=1 FL=1
MTRRRAEARSPIGVEQEAGGLLQTVFKDGELLRRQTLAEIRARLRSGG